MTCYFADDADSSIYISARTSQTSATRDNSSQEVDGAVAGGSYYPQGGGLQSYTGDMTTAKFNPSPNGVPPNSVMFNNFMSTSSVQTNSHPTPTAVLQPPMGFFQDLRREQGSAAMGDSPVGAAYGHQVDTFVNHYLSFFPTFYFKFFVNPFFPVAFYLFAQCDFF